MGDHRNVYDCAGLIQVITNSRRVSNDPKKPRQNLGNDDVALADTHASATFSVFFHDPNRSKNIVEVNMEKWRSSLFEPSLRSGHVFIKSSDKESWTSLLLRSGECFNAYTSGNQLNMLKEQRGFGFELVQICSFRVHISLFKRGEQDTRERAHTF